MIRHPQRLRPMAEAGFTLTQLAVAAAILILVSAISFPSLVRSYQEQRLRQAALELQSHLQRARSFAERLQGSCGVAITNTSGEVKADVIAAGSVCSSSNLASLNLNQLTAVRGLAVSSDTITGLATSTASSCSTSTPCNVVFNGLGILNDNPQILYLSSSATSAQFCVNVGFSLIRVGSRDGSSGTCDYSRN